METTKDSTFETDSLYLASYLKLSGYDYTLALKSPNEIKTIFTFYDHDGKLKEYVTNYMTGAVPVNLPKYNQTLKRIRRESIEACGNVCGGQS